MEAEEDEWSGLWNKGVFKRWNKSDLLKNDRVFTNRYVYKLKRNAKTGSVYHFKSRLIVRGFEMVKGLDYEVSFSPTPGISITRLMVSITATNDLELHSVDIEQVFTQTDKLKKGANVKYFITPSSDSPDADDKSVVYEVLKPLYGTPSSPRALHKTMDAYFRSEGFDYCLIACKSAGIMVTFKRIIGNSLIISRSQILQDTLCYFQMNYTWVLYKLTQLRVSKSQIWSSHVNQI
jgi:hypothetical protein